MSCPFCPPDPVRVFARNEYAIALRDGFPISRGHTLIIPKRHVASMTDLDAAESAGVFALLSQARASLDQELAPDGYNIGINDGVAAGQTVMHLHVHLIPRFLGDRADPRGGVRWIIPEKADYWSGLQSSSGYVDDAAT